jgi:hypothetical protein
MDPKEIEAMAQKMGVKLPGGGLGGGKNPFGGKKK